MPSPSIALLFCPSHPVSLVSTISTISTGIGNLISCTLGIQSIEQMKNEYGSEFAEIIAGISGNIISGQVTGDSAKKLSETFGKIMQDRESVSINSSETSVSKSTQLDYAIPASKIATLSSGEFVGIVADSPNEKISLKMFHAELQNDNDAIAKEEAAYVDIPVIRQVSYDDLQENYVKIKSDIQRLVADELKEEKDEDPIPVKKPRDKKCPIRKAVPPKKGRPVKASSRAFHYRI